MINWVLDVEDVDCPVDDIVATDGPRSSIQRGMD